MAAMSASNVRAADSGKLVRPAAELGWRLVEGIAGAAPGSLP